MKQLTIEISYEEMERILLEYLTESVAILDHYPDEPKYKKRRKAFYTVIESCASDFEQFLNRFGETK